MLLKTKNKKAHFYMGLSRYFASQCQRVLIGGLFPLNYLHRTQLIDLYENRST